MTKKLPPFIKLTSVDQTYTWRGKTLAALRSINIDIPDGQTLGIVGESGSGKSTLGRIAACLESPASGTVSVRGRQVREMDSKDRFRLKRTMQAVYQDPYSSLNPLMTIEQCIGEGIAIHKIAHGSERKALIAQLLHDVGLPAEAMERYPHEFSGGQRQRIVIARALAVGPEFLVCDEPLAALDMCTQKQVMDLFKKLKRERLLTMLFISHDISAVRMISDHIAVMYLGMIVEYGPADEVCTAPKHPYTRALISSIPIPDPVLERSRQKIVLYGDPPSPMSPPEGCPFHPRCMHATDLCRSERAKLVVSEGSSAACHFPPLGDC